MALSALTVTPPSPTPPTNFSCRGVTGPNPPNYTKVNYAEPFGDLDANGNWTGTSLAPGDRKNPNPPTDTDDGTAGSLVAFAANAAAVAGGTGATSGGTEGTYPGTGTGVNGVGAVPSPSSAAHEGAGLEAVYVPPGNIQYTFPGPVTVDTTRWVSAPDVAKPYSPLGTAAAPSSINNSHPSTLSGSAVPTLTGATGASNVSGVGTTVLTVTGTNFNRASVVNINGIPQTTNYVSATSLTVDKAMKRTTAGTLPVTVTSNGVTTAPQNWTLT